MPVSKNKRKSKKAQSRKVNRAKVAGNFGGGGVYDTFDYPPPEAPQGAIPGIRPPETSIGGNRRYQVTSPDGPALSELEQIDAIIERSVTFEMTEPHHDNIGLREIDLDGEMGGEDISAPMVATIKVDPLSAIEGHPKWQTGQELIDFLDSDPNVFRGEFDGNRWQGSGARWDECPPNVLDCSYRVVVEASGTPPGCAQCETELRPEELHFHFLDESSILTMCEGCWSKGPLPEEDRTLGANVGA
jgi:hypothetical protein